MQNKDRKEYLYEDAGLLLLLLMLGAMSIMMMLSSNVIVNTIYLFLTIAILIITYFLGLIPSLLANLVFIALQGIVMLYEYFGLNRDIQWHLLFWLVMPLIVSFIMYVMTRSQIALQNANSDLHAALVERGAFDQQTNLRTMVAYVEDASVFVETSRRFGIPVTTLIIKIRYFNDLRRMMSDRQLEVLLMMASEIIKSTTRDNDITYILDNDDPTWATLLYTDSVGGNIAAKRTKEAFDRRIKENPELANLAISMVVGVSQWNVEEMNNPYDLMNDGIKETQYDV